ncbi:hypothetical protein LJC22_07235 [Desulfosarcina sp. OttesenSCG-928-G10]|nr:hypothetical protein [Desulfosarcina sp. OttesenSCG-928-G10]
MEIFHTGDGRDIQRAFVCFIVRCAKRGFSERKGTVLFGSRLPEEKVVDALGHLFEQNGIRQTARLVGVNKNTVNRLARIAGKHAESAYADIRQEQYKDF